ncbi:MAG: hypothetical protein JST38_02660 [Bacteroidetes bacterium]|nr:hypothetical protein [Bacteroidota bacterium]MBS1568319.1 hypothetical protein [Bacteroidota bacterium]MBS1939762.1 hypothetical protein [Bacteroidota bacterium]
MRILIFTLWLSILLTGCSNRPQGGSTLSVSDSVTVHLGYSMRSDLATTWHDPYTGVEYFVFAEPTTKKCISFVDLSGQPILTVQLDSALTQLDDVNAFSVVNMDSIWLMPAHQNRVVLINRDGKVIDRILLDPCSTTPEGDRYEYSATIFGGFHYKRSLVLRSYFKENVLDSLSDGVVQPRIQYVQGFYSALNPKPYLAVVDLGVGGSCSARLGIDSFYTHLSQLPFNSTEAKMYVVMGDSVWILSAYSDRIFVADIRELKVRRTVQFHSDHTPTYIPPPVIDQEEADSRGKNLNHRFATEGYIQNLVRDRRTGQIVLAVYHQVPWDSPPEKTKIDRPFSLLIFDKALTHQVAEYVFDDIRHDGFCLLPTQAGLYMIRHEDKQAQASPQHGFDLFVLPQL